MLASAVSIPVLHLSLFEINTLLHIGQLPQNIALRLKHNGVAVLGTDPEKIDSAEDRHKFSSILDSVGVDQPEWIEATSVDAAKDFARKVGFVNSPQCSLIHFNHHPPLLGIPSSFVLHMSSPALL